MAQSADLKSLLKRHFGYDEFRPLQEEIIRDVLGGKDVVALLPTGGGKSLCFQLAALARPGLTVVVSPLIALMKDQVDSLRAAGISATFLNSTLTRDAANERIDQLARGEIKLLYVAPERLMTAGFFDSLAAWKVTLFAIDEAHCISEWGHDFRPEYRQLATVRERFPGVPVMALTATATDRVRKDIAAQLKFRNHAEYVASFNRPNLTYRVLAKSGAYEQLLEFIRARKGESGIVYCLAKKTADSLASRLVEDGIRAGSYHAGMEPAERARQQEAFIRDRTPVICATIAFGMGINKPNVRYVVHYDLPKNIEGYYQETGRAGRDGLPSECLLLYSPGDRIKFSGFIDEKPDEKERELARAQLELIVHYAEEAGCRRQHLLRYFGEPFEGDCGSCDNCLSPRETWDGTVAAQKFLSCVYRIREKSGFSVGVGHVVDVLCGKNSEKVRQWGHETISTFGIGKEHAKEHWSAIGRELVRLGLLYQNPERFNTLEITQEGREALRSRKTILLTKAAGEARKARSNAGQIECDEALFEKLRALRGELAEKRSVPAYVIFSDVSLRQMARYYPQTDGEFSRISGVGERKLAEFKAVFVAAIEEHLNENPRVLFEEEARPISAAKPRLNETTRQSLDLFRQGLSVEEIASRRGFSVSTIYGHLATAVEGGEKVEITCLLSAEALPEIAAAFAKHGFENISGVRDTLGNRYDYGVLKLYRAAQGSVKQ